MGRCGGCGQRQNPTQAPVVGPAVVLGNGAVIPLDDDDALDRFVARHAQRRPGEPVTVIRTGESLPA